MTEKLMDGMQSISINKLNSVDPDQTALSGLIWGFIVCSNTCLNILGRYETASPHSVELFNI